MKNAIIKAINERKSTKSYLDVMPSDEDINEIINAGLRAASGRNMQAPIIVAVTNKEIRDKLSQTNAEIMGAKSDPFYGAPAVLVVLARKKAHTYVYDGSLTLGNMMLAAQSLGLGSCWVHRARETFEMPEWKEWLSSIGVSEEVEGIGNLILGYPDGKFDIKAVDEGRVFFVK
jgi:nitroreductase